MRVWSAYSENQWFDINKAHNTRKDSNKNKDFNVKRAQADLPVLNLEKQQDKKRGRGSE